MAALPPKWEVLVLIICQGEDLNDLDLSLVCNTVIAQYKTEANRGQHRNHTANRLSAVKCKCGDPHFNQQQGSSQQRPSTSSNQQQHRQRSSRGKGRGGSINKGKQRVHNPAHSHIASMVALPAPTTHTVAHIGPSHVTTRVVTMSEPKQRVPGPYSSLNQALTLAECLDVTPTIQTTKTMEQRFTDFNCEVTSCPNWKIVGDSNSDIDMSQAVESHHDYLQTTLAVLDDNNSELDLFSAFGNLTIGADNSNTENHAPTPESHNPQEEEASKMTMNTHERTQTLQLMKGTGNTCRVSRP